MVSKASLADQIKELERSCESFLEANRVALDIIGEMEIPEEHYALRARLGVVEDILDGANTRYTD